MTERKLSAQSTTNPRLGGYLVGSVRGYNADKCHAIVSPVRLSNTYARMTSHLSPSSPEAHTEKATETNHRKHRPPADPKRSFNRSLHHHHHHRLTAKHVIIIIMIVVVVVTWNNHFCSVNDCISFTHRCTVRRKMCHRISYPLHDC